MPHTLSKEEIRQRLIRLRNVETLHEAQRFKIWHLRDENRKLKQEVKLLKITVETQQKTIDDLKLQMEELRNIVFGKKRNKNDRDLDSTKGKEETSEPRTRESYRRDLPREDEITEIRNHPIDRCNCGEIFSERENTQYYEEDIPLPQPKVVIKHVIERGYCKRCRKWSSGAKPPAARVVIGQNARRYIAYLAIVCRESYSQIEDILRQSYNFNISEGEIAKILGKEGDRLRIECERLKEQIRGEPSIHMDETGWNILLNQGEKGYAWTMTGGVSGATVFTLGKSRGKGNAEDLLGSSEAVIVSDDYAVYRNLNREHQLCLSHILRKLRDLAKSGEITGAIHARCLSAYHTFAGIYADIKKARDSNDPVSRYNTLHTRLEKFAEILPNDPLKLSRVKTQIKERSTNYLTCLLHPNVAPDNNAAERSLRHLVLKRKISFGSLNEKTAEIMAILCSVLLTYKKQGGLRSYLMGV